jgi:1-aminocyclopropane-1-carboxylate deaminase/D-cysteine desulfhydrase-like pyridoxal-dependent ACC family enzyme
MNLPVQVLLATLLTPVEFRRGRFYKRDDLLRGPGGINGGKYRTCSTLIESYRRRGATHIVTGASLRSPQLAMTAVLAAKAGLPCTLVVGGTTPETSLRYPSVRVAAEAGARFDYIGNPRNPAIQSRVRLLAAEIPRSSILPYGVTPSDEDLGECVHNAAQQVRNVPYGLDALLVPFGSGNSALGILTGLSEHPAPPRDIVLVGVGPDRTTWLRERLDLLGVNPPPYRVEPTGYAYTDNAPYREDEVELHPTYEGKVATWADAYGPQAWRERSGAAALWVVGAALQ